MRIKIRVPRMALEIANERQVVEAMTKAVKTNVLSRLSRGQGSRGPLPEPKDGGKPLVRSGSLIRSIDAVLRDGSSGRVGGIVTPLGNHEEKAARHQRREEKKAAASALGLALVGLSGGDVKATKKQQALELRAARAVARGLRAVGRIPGQRAPQVRKVIRNAAIAAVLSVPPKDARSRAGGRGVYRVFEATAEDQRDAVRMAESLMDPRLREIGTHEGGN